MEITSLNKSTLAEQIMEQIASSIISGELKPGQKLPTERELALLFKVSRSRVREALRALSLIGLISIHPGEGSFVTESNSLIPFDTVTWMYHKELQNVDDIYAARKLIETEVYLSLYDHLTDDILRTVKEYFEKIMNADLKKISEEEFLSLLSDMDNYVGTVCGNVIYTKLMQTIIFLRKDSSINILKLPGSKKLARDSRKKVLKCLEEGNRSEFKESLDTFYKVSTKNLH